MVWREHRGIRKLKRYGHSFLYIHNIENPAETSERYINFFILVSRHIRATETRLKIKFSCFRYFSEFNGTVLFHPVS